jgi:hypothetical protein
MVTIVTDMGEFGIKSCIFLKKNDEKSSKKLETGLKNWQIHLFSPPNSVFESKNVTENLKK